MKAARDAALAALKALAAGGTALPRQAAIVAYLNRRPAANHEARTQGG
jgi:hypothetical protein